MIELCKYHGCGNDFILTTHTAFSEEEKKQMVIAYCDRHTGIGADGFIFVHKAPLEMEFYNCDGSKAPMCGNGIRCFAKYIYDEGICDLTEYEVQTLAGHMKLKVTSLEPFEVCVTIGKPSLDPSLIHSDQGREVYGYPMSVMGEIYTIDTLFIGTIHTVLFVSNAFDERLEELGKRIHDHPLFLEKTNVNFVEVVDEGHIRLQTYERGVGMTLACGTGCCAAVWDAWKHGFVNDEVAVELVKGTLYISIDENEMITMRGSAKRIMKGAGDL